MKKIVLITYFILFFSLLASCSQNKTDETQLESNSVKEEIDLVRAKQIIDTGCIVCHSATASEENRMAPPLEGVKRRYLEKYPKIEDFTTAMVDFIISPSEENAIMFGAVDRFGVMLPMAYTEKDLKAIATYIYQFELERPDWLEEHYQEMHGD